MTFRVDSYLRSSSARTATTRRLMQVPGRETCEGCAWYQLAVTRCCHPHHGCTSGQHRIQPWVHFQPCPVTSKTRG